ncbi:acyltransferase family protein [Nocardiopsis valliformis]|uniref:acyltransferase family protein n=1 Tax=Nocardiopsis valliformis TaxID=239974 RepID=UPI000345B728|nr:acyltransferase [Nocardiopsis valliformis]
MTSRGQTFGGGVRRAARNTPASRDRYVDFLRALAILLVVVGHWLAVVIVSSNGMTGENALAELAWARPMTWLFQVMPVFFLVGGYSNAASLASHQCKGGDSAGWLLGRTDRLLRPTSAFLALLWASALAAGLAGADRDLIAVGVWAASIPLWFLAAYLGVVLCAPAMYALHRRAGTVVPVLLIGVVLLLDVLRLGAGVPLVGDLNYLLVWLTMHQVGFLWRDRWTGTGPLVPGGVAVAGLGLLVTLTVFGPYPVSMVDVPGEDLGNASPPTFVLLLLGLVQTAVVLVLARPARRMLRRIGPWTVVVAVNSVVLSLFLWHMLAAVLAGALLHGTGLFPEPAVGSPQWLLFRIPWLLAVSAVMAVLLAVFGRIEARTTPSSAGWRAGGLRELPPGQVLWNAVTWPALLAVILGLVWVALAGPEDHGVGMLPTAAFASYVAGATVLRLARRRHAGAEQRRAE